MIQFMQSAPALHPVNLVTARLGESLLPAVQQEDVCPRVGWQKDTTTGA